MKHVFQHFNRKHGYVFLGFYLAFACLTLFVLSRQPASDWRDNWNMARSLVPSPGTSSRAAGSFQSRCFPIVPYSCWVALRSSLCPFHGRRLRGGSVLWCGALACSAGLAEVWFHSDTHCHDRTGQPDHWTPGRRSVWVSGVCGPAPLTTVVRPQEIHYENERQTNMVSGQEIWLGLGTSLQLAGMGSANGIPSLAYCRLFTHRIAALWIGNCLRSGPRKCPIHYLPPQGRETTLALGKGLAVDDVA